MTAALEAIRDTLQVVVERVDGIENREHAAAPALVAAPPAAPPAAATASGGFLRAAAKGVALVALIVCLLVAAVLSSAKFAGNAVKLAVESADRKLLGVDITVENAAVSFFQGIVEISGLKAPRRPLFEQGTRPCQSFSPLPPAADSCP